MKNIFKCKKCKGQMVRTRDRGMVCNDCEIGKNIKFRFFGKNSKEFLGEGTGNIFFTLKEIQNIHDIDSWIASQSTGLFDKNGKEISCGDIIVETRVYGGYVRKYRKHIVDISFGYNRNFKGSHKWEIIGNIYQNPELIK